MASRKEQKEQARAEREALERQSRAEAQRGRRLRVLAAAVVVAVVVVVVAIAASSSGSKKQGLSKGSAAAGVTATVRSELQGIPQSGTRLGAANAPVTLDYFGDLECPVCASFTQGALAQAIAGPVRAGKLQVHYRSLETATPQPQTFQDQQVAAYAAGRQNRLWYFIELFYRQQGQEGTGYVTPAFVTGIAKQVPGLDLAKWSAARSDPALRNQVSADATAASRIGANATPWLVFKGPKGTKQLSGAPQASTVSQAIASVSG